MAKKDDKRDDDEEAAAAPAKAPMSTKMIVIIVALVALLIGGGGAGAAFYFINKKPSPADVAKAEEAKAKEEAAKPKKTYYFEFKPPFLVNYQWNGRHHYLQMTIAVMARDDNVVDLVSEHQPLIRNNVGMLMGGQDFDLMRTPEGKETIRQLLFDEIQSVLKAADDKTEGIEKVYFTNFVMQ